MANDDLKTKTKDVYSNYSSKKESEKESSKEITPLSNAISLLEEKLVREYDLSLAELRARTITIKNGEVSVAARKDN